MLSINTNLSSLITQRSMKSATSLLNQAVERMSTGYKVNHAKDNAAAYSIITNMDTKINAYQVAEDNCAMGLDLLTTATESLDLIYDKLTRLRDLAEQASNGTYGEQSLRAINSEANALVDEIERLYATSEYNGNKLLVVENGFLKEVEKVDTSGMTPLSEIDESAVLAQGEYTINSADDLAKLARMQNAGKITAGSTFVQTANIDLSSYSDGEGWTPIGGGADGFSSPFKSNYNGNGYTISNLHINRNVPGQGLFGYCENANIENLGVISGSVKGYYNNGGLLGMALLDSTVSNCFANVEVGTTSGQYSGIGGLAGVFRGIIENSYATGNVRHEGTGSSAAGLVGQICNNITIRNCYATGDVYGYNFVGGLIGGVGSRDYVVNIENCFATGDVTGADGVAGFAPGGGNIFNFKNCYSTGDVYVYDSSISEAWIGGFCGYSDTGSTYENCYSTGDVYCENDYCVIGGFALILNNSILTNCYSTGTVTVKEPSALSKYADFVYRYDGANPTLINSNYYESGSTPFVLNHDYIDTPTNRVGLQVGINGDETTSRLDVKTGISFQHLDELRDLGIKAGNYLGILDGLMGKVLDRQTHLGSATNRLDSALEEISTQYENLVSSRSTLRDADIAEVSSEYIQQQILQQASATLMATANQAPAIALQLI